MYEQFKARAEGVSAEVHRFANSEEALVFLVDFFAKEGVTNQAGQYGVFAKCPFLAGIDCKALEAVDGLNLAVTREQAAGAKVGVSQVDWALADGGYATSQVDAEAVRRARVGGRVAVGLGGWGGGAQTTA